MYTYDKISPNSSQNENFFRQNLYRKSQHTFYVQYPLSENCTVYEIMWKNTIGLQPDWPQMTI